MEHDTLQRLLNLTKERRPVPLTTLVEAFGDTWSSLEEQLKEFNGIDPIFEFMDDAITQTRPVELLNPVIIQQQLSQEVLDNINLMEFFTTIPSTNDYLKNTAKFDKQTKLCIAEHQSSGRGRRGRTWVSPLAQNLYFSFAKRIHIPQEKLGLVSLFVGVGVAESIAGLGIDDIKIKWPNDVYWRDAKLAGILIDAKSVTPHYADLVVGVGVNVHMQKSAAEAIDQDWVALHDLHPDLPNRSTLMASLIAQIMAQLDRIEQQDFDELLLKWRQYDYLSNKPVKIHSDTPVLGQAIGINARGELQVLVGDQAMSINAGEVSVRLQAPGENV